jgi:HD-GYP domain-containing protein (c-di-GMP phosphodiesterase class II)
MTAEELGLDVDRCERIRLAGLLHDVGWIGLPDDILSKEGPLSTEEWKDVRTHPALAARLLARPELGDLRGWIAAHHERPDGQGYPRGLQVDDIPLEARILAVADAYEAMTNERAYRPAMSDQAAHEELRAGAGTQFDGGVVDAFLQALSRRLRVEGRGKAAKQPVGD